ncbi:hypothetical protein [Kitasatospora sp. NPDC057541]|uniref:hypothetical protein n=1 Tax=unclassified Kitasatospora TaxID=2633591 RepID=UPI0036A96026
MDNTTAPGTARRDQVLRLIREGRLDDLAPGPGDEDLLDEPDQTDHDACVYIEAWLTAAYLDGTGCYAEPAARAASRLPALVLGHADRRYACPPDCPVPARTATAARRHAKAGPTAARRSCPGCSPGCSPAGNGTPSGSCSPRSSSPAYPSGSPAATAGPTPDPAGRTSEGPAQNTSSVLGRALGLRSAGAERTDQPCDDVNRPRAALTCCFPLQGNDVRALLLVLPPQNEPVPPVLPPASSAPS